MLVLHGGPALSEFRRLRLLADMRQIALTIKDTSADYVYLAATTRELSTHEHHLLQALLNKATAETVSAGEGELFFVIPRFGTISPWASKATDIAHICGLTAVIRIERCVAYRIVGAESLVPFDRRRINNLIHDRMTQAVVSDVHAAALLFQDSQPAPLKLIALSEDPLHALTRANETMGLALSAQEIDYLSKHYAAIARAPTDVELMMFAQANSEHCRHKIFNADWVIDGEAQHASLFDMIRNTYNHAAAGILSAYKDNAAVLQGTKVRRFWPDPVSRSYMEVEQDTHIIMKVETHNHPTAISPFPGAATGAGGEIRDGAATGIGGKPKAGLCGFSVSNLRIPGFERPWEENFGTPDRIASALDIMLEGPIGAAAFNNEFGRPNLAGYFRTFEQRVDDGTIRGYHKPIMLAGGVGNLPDTHVHKRSIPPGTPIVVLGGPAMLIGLGGGAASSMASGASAEALDFASVQRENPEMQRRCQEVIDRCVAQGKNSPILSIHDVGAGGLSNAVPELLWGAKQGGRIDLRAIPNDEPGMSPLEIWCNEAQERYTLAVCAMRIEEFKRLCERERCPYAVIGYSDESQQLTVSDRHFGNTPVDLPLEVLLGKPPKLRRDVRHVPTRGFAFMTGGIDLNEAVERVLRLPSVAGKNFLITIGDRTVGGLVSRDQMVGPWQVPVADVAVTCADYCGYAGEAMALGEHAPIALINPPASGRMAVGEALTNIAAALITELRDVRLSANWMAAAGCPGEEAALYDTVRAVGQELCPALGVAIPVGKDSLSMRTVWEQDGKYQEVIAPLSLIVSAFTPVIDVRRTLTPQLRTEVGETDLILIDLGHRKNRLGGSALAQVYGHIGDQTPDVDDPDRLKRFFVAIQELNSERLLLAYHDRSGGGLLVTLCEMAFAGHCGIDIELGNASEDSAAALFSEELGAVLQVRRADVARVLTFLRAVGLEESSGMIGTLNDEDTLVVRSGSQVLLERSRVDLQKSWAETNYRMQALRDNPECAAQEFAAISDAADPGLTVHLTFALDDDVAAPYIASGVRPLVAIVREQGVNGQIEMAAAFNRAGFDAVDMHMSDLMAGRASLSGFKGLVAGGGFSYGDVLGAGGGWAKSILFNPRVREQFAAFFNRGDTFGLGVCNGCQMFSYLQEIVPGASHWPRFARNTSEQFEARLSLVEILPTPSIFFVDMQGAVLPIATAHGEGRVNIAEAAAEVLLETGLVSLRYVDNDGGATERYPQNPSGSPLGIAGLTSENGRVAILMPHPERVFRTVQYSWHPDEWGEDGPWLRMFRNARVWVG